jgi:pyruvate dehydrogenase E2 component (dihydrolipoamide acetyltransferase)
MLTLDRACQSGKVRRRPVMFLRKAPPVMAIEIRMPALSPTMEEGTLAKWLVKEGDSVSSGDLLAEIETDKATMEFEAIDEGVIGKIAVPAGTENVKVGTVIATIIGEGEEAPAEAPKAPEAKAPAPVPAPAAQPAAAAPAPSVAAPAPPKGNGDGRIKASPLAKRLAATQGVDLSAVSGSGPNGRIVKADLEGAPKGAVAAAPKAEAPAPAAAPAPSAKAPAASPTDYPTPHELVKLSGMRKTIARRLTESKQTVPHARHPARCAAEAAWGTQ